MPLSLMIARVLRLLLAAGALSGLVLGALWWSGKPPKETQGIWITNGYGLVFDISPVSIAIHEITPVSCIPWQTMPAHMGMVRRLAGYTFTAQGDDLSIAVADAVGDMRAYRVDALPDQCVNGRQAGPLETFDIFWRTFETHYPNFARYGVDWDARRDEAMAALAGNFDPKHLSDVMTHAVRDLDDGDIHLMTPSGDVSPHSPAPWDKDQRALWQVTDSYLTSERQFIETSGIRHGWLDGEIAYLGVHHMESEPPLGQTMASQAARVVDQLGALYADAKGVIVDLRFNAGGSDTVALTYAGLFSATDWPAGSKQTQITRGYMSPATAFYGRGAQAALTAPVMVLTSSETSGAAETYVMAVGELAQVSIMGEPTNATPSNIMVRTLPNQWQFTLPHQTYALANGTPVTQTGIAPDISYPFDVEGFSNGKDTMLEAALTRLAQAR